MKPCFCRLPNDLEMLAILNWSSYVGFLTISGMFFFLCCLCPHIPLCCVFIFIVGLFSAFMFRWLLVLIQGLAWNLFWGLPCYFLAVSVTPAWRFVFFFLFFVFFWFFFFFVFFFFFKIIYLILPFPIFCTIL